MNINHGKTNNSSEIPHNVLRNFFADTYRSNSTILFAENFNNSIELNQQSSKLHSNNDNGNDSNMKNCNNLNEIEYINLNAKQHRLHLQWQMQRTKMPEKFLAPHYLDNSCYYMIGMRVAISQ